MESPLFSVIVSGKIHFGDIEKMYCGVSERFLDISFVEVHYESETFYLKGDKSLEYPINKNEVCKNCLKKIMPFLNSSG